ncbi:hypothetical protein OPIT5_18215 [Opitutaceae bacterium TAV5]|nr:hypothetical protein OPIT5_18215 [Opitutaceae bacterium TAV5]
MASWLILIQARPEKIFGPKIHFVPEQRAAIAPARSSVGFGWNVTGARTNWRVNCNELAGIFRGKTSHKSSVADGLLLTMNWFCYVRFSVSQPDNYWDWNHSFQVRRSALLVHRVMLELENMKEDG